ncbi:MAG: Gfo/Idh/MocA family oxidoreductase [Kiritimatiellae bacterium]|nr:Gfo/Idh/MocA family oxidoreductase [Kiritimatiellia bacterium]
MRILKMGQVGGGIGAFIGEVHRKAARMDGGIVLAAGAFDVVPENSLKQGKLLGLDPKRVYSTYQEMIAGELALPLGERVDFIAVCTPNHTHYPIAKACIQAGFNVMCEKPMTLTVKEAEDLEALVKKTGVVFGLMHNYTAYPMVKLAKDMVKQGDLGKLRKVVVQYPQGWLWQLLEKSGQMQASWRTNPKTSGAAGSMGDIGTHAANLAEYITGLKITEVLADLTAFVKGRKLDDDGNVLLHFEKGVKGLLHASQIAVGEENNLKIWIYGDKKGLWWSQENPNFLHVISQVAPEEIWKRGNGYVADKSKTAARGTRIPSGHPEGFLEAFANNYANFADTIRAKEEKRRAKPEELDFPSVEAGVRGMKFINAVVTSSKKGNIWVKI